MLPTTEPTYTDAPEKTESIAELQKTAFCLIMNMTDEQIARLLSGMKRGNQ